MKNIGTFRLAFWSGVFAEVMACVLFVLCLGYDSSTPGPASSSIITFIYTFHWPGVWLASHLGPILILPLALLSGMVSFAIIFWPSISLWRRCREKYTPA